MADKWKVDPTKPVKSLINRACSNSDSAPMPNHESFIEKMKKDGLVLHGQILFLYAEVMGLADYYLLRYRRSMRDRRRRKIVNPYLQHWPPISLLPIHTKVNAKDEILEEIKRKAQNNARYSAIA
ncbi:unnamed protein product [Dovyalis caffra]|uniref:Uncharacterized protein n=1 Tax=Dovyalis caffra TaxID=77055 RepID=A0AAV1R2V1_9ROSI|nr:unnamed protein product [Dovyalis caffra]